jgi:hypothetical protein
MERTTVIVIKLFGLRGLAPEAANRTLQICASVEGTLDKTNEFVLRKGEVRPYFDKSGES